MKIMIICSELLNSAWYIIPKKVCPVLNTLSI